MHFIVKIIIFLCEKKFCFTIIPYIHRTKKFNITWCSFEIKVFKLYIFSLEEFYTVGDPVYARDLWLVVELASDNRFFKYFFMNILYMSVVSWHFINIYINCLFTFFSGAAALEKEKNLLHMFARRFGPHRRLDGPHW